MTRFFQISHNSHYKNGFPWGSSDNRHYRPKCDCCGAQLADFTIPFEMELRPDKGKMWPDILGSGKAQSFFVSNRFVEGWNTNDLGPLPSASVSISKTIPPKLRGVPNPGYRAVDGAQLLGAKMDFEASGYVGVTKCESCGVTNYDISATYDRQNKQEWPISFVEGSWTGLNLFTTDLSCYAFYCTEKVVDLARAHRLLNIRFTPVEEGKAISSKGLDYLK